MRLFYPQQRLAFAMLLTASLFQLTSKAQTFPINETRAANNTPAQAMPLQTLPVKLRGTLAGAADIDFYSFQAAAGDKLFATAMTSFSPGSGDLTMSVFGPDGTTLLEFDNDNGTFSSTSPSIAGTVLPATGTYYIRLTDVSVTNTAARGYDLYVVLKSGAPQAEVEPNDAQGQATPLPANGFVSGSRDPLTPAVDIDFFSITLQAGETVFISMDLDPEKDGVSYNGRIGVGTFGDPALILVADDPNAVETVTPSYPSEALLMTVKNAGTYYIYADAALATVGGPTATYNIAVTRFAAQTGYVNYASTDVPKAIGPALGSVSSSINIPDNVRIQDMSVRINLTHTLMQDIDATLTNPAGQTIHLFSDIGPATANTQNTMDLFFNDYNAVPPSFTPTQGMGYTPETVSRLDQFVNTSAAGNWVLTLYDDANATNGGTLLSWSIDILSAPAITLPAPLYSFDFEANDGGFTAAGTANNWAWGTPNSPATTTTNPLAAFSTANSGVNCWKTNLTGSYSINSAATLSSPILDLATVTGVTYVNWAMKSQMESTSFDKLVVYVEEEGTGLQQVLYEWFGATQVTAVGSPAVNIGASGGWGSWYGDISSFNGKQVRFKVAITTDNTVVLQGAAIDDVKIFNLVTLADDETYLRGTRSAAANKLQWKANCGASGSAVLTLERSNNGRDFTAIHQEAVTAERCREQFNYVDAAPKPGKNYYRVKTVTETGKITYSSILLLLNQETGLQLMSISPNPVTGGSFKLNATTAKATTIQVVISDASGKALRMQNSRLVAGFNSIEVIAAGLPAGVYYVHGVTEMGKTAVQKMVKQ